MNFAFLSLFIFACILISCSSRFFSKSLLVFSVLIGIMEVIAQSVITTDSLSPIFENPLHWILLFVKTGIVFYLLGFLCYFLFEQKILLGTEKKDFYHRHAFCIILLLFILSWIPVFIINYPFYSSYDSREQYTQFLNAGIPFTNHHPVFSTLWMGSIYWLGNSFLGLKEGGVLLNNIVQTTFLSISLAYMFSFFEKHNIRRSVQVLFFLILRFVFFPTFIVLNKKDVLFTAFFIGFCVSTISLYQAVKITRKDLFIFSFYGIMMCFFRNTGIYCLIPTIIFLFWGLKQNLNRIQKIALWTAPTIFVIWTTLGYSLLNVIPVSGGEKLSIPFLQTARVVTYHSNSLSGHQKYVISTILDYHKLPSAYKLTYEEGTADAIKFPTPPEWNHREGCYKLARAEDEISKTITYLFEWMKMGFSYPTEYLIAFVAHTSGYFSVSHFKFNAHPFKQLVQILKSDKKQKYLKAINLCVKDILFFSCFSTNATPVWFILFCVIYLLETKRIKSLIPFAPVIILFLTCLVSPSRGSFRYFVPISACSILLIGYTASLCKNVHLSLKEKKQKTHLKLKSILKTNYISFVFYFILWSLLLFFFLGHKIFPEMTPHELFLGIDELDLTLISIYWKELLICFIGILLLSFLSSKYWFVGAIVFLFCSYGVIKSQYTQIYYGDYLGFYQKEYTTPVLKSNGKLKNIIFLLLEAIENTYGDEKYWGENYIPNLTRLQSEGLTIQGYHLIPRTETTIRSIGATMCGIPGILGSEAKEKFLPGATCLSDILNQHHYHNIFMQSGELGFAKTNMFILDHHFDDSYGVNEIIQKGWANENDRIKSGGMKGLPDSVMLNSAKKKLLEISHEKPPFFMAIYTLNTHTPMGYVEPQCSARHNKNILDAITCSEQVVYDFIRWCQKQDFYKDTVIFVVGDHLMKQELMTDYPDVKMKLDNYPHRETYNVILDGTGKLKSNIIKAQYTQMDWMPTILEAAGFYLPNHRYAMGHSLLGNNPKTLISKYGREDLINRINSDFDNYRKMFKKE